MIYFFFLTPRTTERLDHLHQQEVKKLEPEPGSLWLQVQSGNSGFPRSHVHGELGKSRSTHLQAEAPGGEGGGAACQDRAPEWGFALLVLIWTQPSWLVLLPYSERKEVVKLVTAQGPSGQ